MTQMLRFVSLDQKMWKSIEGERFTAQSVHGVGWSPVNPGGWRCRPTCRRTWAAPGAITPGAPPHHVATMQWDFGFLVDWV